MKTKIKKSIALLLCIITIMQIASISPFAVYYKEYFHHGDTSSNILDTSTERWTSTRTSFIYKYGDNFYTVNVTDRVTVTQYCLAFNKTNEQFIQFELPIWGGFYSGKEYNYMVFGQDNTEASPTKEVYRIVKYDKNFNRISSASINGEQCQTINPFDGGTVAMAESEDGKELTIHTSRKRFASDDGYNHQSQFTVILNTETMSPVNDLQFYQNNHVSHSFNQFVQYDGKTPVLLDHGDAYPRSIVLSKRQENGYYTEVKLFDIPGPIGANQTGISVGGFEISENNYIVAINTIDHSKVTSFDSFTMHGLDKDERNVALLISAKDNTATKNVTTIYLTDYVDNNLHASAPYLVKMDNNFAVIWKEYKLLKEDGGYSYKENAVKYTIVDENGNKLTDVQTLGSSCNLSDCIPMYYNGNIIWYYEMGEFERHIATLAIDDTGSHQHPLNYVYATEATCSAEGNTEYYYCVACNKYYTDSSGKNEIPLSATKTGKLPHTLGEWEIVTPATTTATGKQVKKCTVCNDVIEEETIPIIIILGDINKDGFVTAVDARIILQTVAGLKTSYNVSTEFADMNKDGYVTAVDARIILQIVAGLR